MQTFYYLLPLVPFVTRGVLCLAHIRVLGMALSLPERDIDAHRTVILAMGGFSFTALLGLAVVEGKLSLGLNLPIYYLFVSFISYMVVHNIQSYTFFRWVDQISDALMDSAAMALVLSVVAVVWQSSAPCGFKSMVTILAAVPLAADHVIRLVLMGTYLVAEERSKDSAAPPPPSPPRPEGESNG